MESDEKLEKAKNVSYEMWDAARWYHWKALREGLIFCLDMV